LANGAAATLKGFLRSSFARYKMLGRFLIVGLVNTGVDFLLFLFLMRVAGVNYLVAQIVSYSFGVVNSFLMNKAWTFEDAGRTMSTPVQLVQFVALNILALSLSLIGLKTFNGYLGLNIYLSKILVTGVTWSVRYTGYRFWVFGGRRNMKGCENL